MEEEERRYDDRIRAVTAAENRPRYEAAWVSLLISLLPGPAAGVASSKLARADPLPSVCISIAASVVTFALTRVIWNARHRRRASFQVWREDQNEIRRLTAKVSQLEDRTGIIITASAAPTGGWGTSTWRDSGDGPWSQHFEVYFDQVDVLNQSPDRSALLELEVVLPTAINPIRPVASQRIEVGCNDHRTITLCWQVALQRIEEQLECDLTGTRMRVRNLMDPAKPPMVMDIPGNLQF